MIDLEAETLIPLTKIPKPGNPSEHVAAPTAYRWAKRGVRGKVLETVLVGGRRWTSTQAISRFCQQSDTARPTQSQKERSAAAQNTLKEMGI